MIPHLITTPADSSMKLLKTKVKKFESYAGVDKPIDEQINEFVESNNISIMDVKYIVRSETEVALIIYMEEVTLDENKWNYFISYR